MRSFNAIPSDARPDYEMPLKDQSFAAPSAASKFLQKHVAVPVATGAIHTANFLGRDAATHERNARAATKTVVGGTLGLASRLGVAIVGLAGGLVTGTIVSTTKIVPREVRQGLANAADNLTTSDYTDFQFAGEAEVEDNTIFIAGRGILENHSDLQIALSETSNGRIEVGDTTYPVVLATLVAGNRVVAQIGVVRRGPSQGQVYARAPRN